MTRSKPYYRKVKTGTIRISPTLIYPAMFKRTKKEWKAVQVRHIHLHTIFPIVNKITQNIPLIYLSEKIFAGKGEIKADTVHIPVSGWKHGDYEFTARVTSDGVTYAISPVKTFKYESPDDIDGNYFIS